MKHDRSIRHFVLERRILSIALVLFLLCRSSFFFDTPEPWQTGFLLNIPVLAVFLFVIFCFSLMQFRLRARAEDNDIMAYVAKMHRTVLRAEQLKSRIAGFERKTDGALISERLSVWQDAIDAQATSPLLADLQGLEQFRRDLKALDLSAPQLVNASNETSEVNRAPDFAEPATGAANTTDPQISVLAQASHVEAVCRSFETRAERLEAAIRTSTTVLRDMRAMFSDENGRGVDALSSATHDAATEMDKLRQTMRHGEKAYRIDRQFSSVVAPQLASVLLVALSFDKVLDGFQILADRISTFLA